MSVEIIYVGELILQFLESTVCGPPTTKIHYKLSILKTHIYKVKTGK